jgi:hypothetical protein
MNLQRNSRLHCRDRAPFILQRNRLVNAHCAASLLGGRRSQAGHAMEMVMSEHGARVLRDESSQISSNSEKQHYHDMETECCLSFAEIVDGFAKAQH